MRISTFKYDYKGKEYTSISKLAKAIGCKDQYLYNNINKYGFEESIRMAEQYVEKIQSSRVADNIASRFKVTYDGNSVSVISIRYNKKRFNSWKELAEYLNYDSKNIQRLYRDKAYDKLDKLDFYIASDKIRGMNDLARNVNKSLKSVAKKVYRFGGYKAYTYFKNVEIDESGLLDNPFTFGKYKINSIRGLDRLIDRYAHSNENKFDFLWNEIIRLIDLGDSLETAVCKVIEYTEELLDQA